ncbi:MAG: hypothetical protein A3F54_01185 [Candidatus Kerfeldbacteria bacterium RIFCSPHIGHO2_12_FULL_48_17]|uniref:Uncharacterized protein n=1 Tax=Candidatus Kerfeldbacteria bacterium RIFCSPHIGHO2_12_FULL_48_17 TaxID=1798542 RepID=A0A1G2B0C1_9BACT|nr:MAG: hypothetical protein A3F54_01185 [Candidatus Kerfeldbacteria bacterium RIFCSPHIGHO2_12_FULL_48_17]
MGEKELNKPEPEADSTVPNHEEADKKYEKVTDQVENEQEEIEQETQELLLSEVAEDAGEVFSQLQQLQSDEQLTPLERKKVTGIFGRFDKLFADVYEKSRSVLPELPRLLVSDVQKGQPLEKDRMSLLVRWMDHYVDGGLSEIYNKCVGFLHERDENGKMSAGEIDYKEQLARNVLPFGYHLSISSKGVEGPKTRIKNIREDVGKYHPNRIAFGGELNEQLRMDLFRRYLGLEPNYDFLKESPYRPTRSTEKNARYFSFDAKSVAKDIIETREAIIEKMKSAKKLSPKTQPITWGIGNELKLAISTKDLNSMESFDQIVEYVKQKQQLPSNDYTSHLGRYKAYIGEDKGQIEGQNKRYVSYYDRWDLNPPLLNKVGIDLNQFNSPFEIYGRIYEEDFEAALNAHKAEQGSYK